MPLLLQARQRGVLSPTSLHLADVYLHLKTAGQKYILFSLAHLAMCLKQSQSGLLSYHIQK